MLRWQQPEKNHLRAAAEENYDPPAHTHQPGTYIRRSATFQKKNAIAESEKEIPPGLVQTCGEERIYWAEYVREFWFVRGARVVLAFALCLTVSRNSGRDQFAL